MSTRDKEDHVAAISEADISEGGGLERIGAGNCGSVWSFVNSTAHIPIAIKRQDGGVGRSLANEYAVQGQIRSVATSIKSALVPEVFSYLESDDGQWPELLRLLPEDSQACNAMVSERIPPVSVATRRMLLEEYCPEETRQAIMKSRENDACLVRIYLGRRRLMQHHRSAGRRPLKFFSLRNFPLHADQVEELQLPAMEYARAMAETLAILHWRVRTDAADVEFVLGNCRADDGKLADDASLAQHPLWLLDFDCCRPIEPNATGLRAIARAFWRNDPYYPRPHTATSRRTRNFGTFSSRSTYALGSTWFGTRQGKGRMPSSWLPWCAAPF